METIHGFIAESAKSADITWPFGLEVNNSIDANRLITAVRLANRKIYSEGSKSPDLSGMGTTVVAALAVGDRVALVSVGDSRIYRLRDGSLEQLSSDDTWLASVLGAKEAEDADPSHPLRHVLTSVVGTKDDSNPSRVKSISSGVIASCFAPTAFTASSIARRSRACSKPPRRPRMAPPSSSTKRLRVAPPTTPRRL